MAIANDVIGMMESDIQKASQKSSGGNASFFVLKAGEKAHVRPLLNLNAIAIISKHDFFNPATGKFDVNAICAETMDLPTSVCKHCVNAKATKNKKLEAVRYYIVPLYVYGIKNAAGQMVTWTDQEGKETPVSGVRYLQLKASSPILATLLELYRDSGDITASDLIISRQGEKLETKYTILNRAPKPFAAPEGVEIAEQSAEAIIMRVGDMNPPDLLDGPDSDHFGANPPAKSNGKVSDAPDF